MTCRVRRLDGGHVEWRVWAPHRERVDLLLHRGRGDEIYRLTPRDDGRHSIILSEVKEGDRYAYLLDGGPPRPDPCSLWQPEGVHRESATFWPETCEWTDDGWSGVPRDELVFYELHVGTFTPEGTFDAVIPRLESLRDLGVTALELMPVAQFPGGRNWGYDGVHLFAVQNTYGGPRGLQRLVDAAHRAGLAVFLDMVYNHFGPEGNYIAEFGPYYSDRYRTPWGPAFNFDGRHSDPVREFVLDNVRYWLEEFHVDGLRLDAVHAMFDISPVHILREIKETAMNCRTGRRRPTIIVESLLNDVRMVHSPERGGYGLDAEWNEDFHHALAAYLTGERHYKYSDFGEIRALANVMERTFHLSGGYSRYRGRRWGAPVGEVPGDRFVIGVQNHDHVGNRAHGERLCMLVEPPVLRLCASLMLCSPHLPLLFMGEEYGERNPFQFFCSFENPSLIEAVCAGRSREYAIRGKPPDPQAEETFLSSKLTWEWTERGGQSGLRRLYTDLLRARRAWPEFQNWYDRSVRVIPDADHGPLIEYVRGGRIPGDDGTVTCYFNMGAARQALPAPPHGQTLLFRSEADWYRGPEEAALADDVLRPYEVVVFGAAR